MTTEEKAKAYDEAIERAKKLQETCDSQAVVGWCEYIFPELKESEDERIRKALVDALNKNLGNGIEKYGTALNAALAWLEKQGEQKPEDKIKPKFKVGDWVVVSTTKGDRVVQIASVEYFKDGYPSYTTTEGRWFGNGTKARLLTDKDVETITLPESKFITYKDKEKQGEQKPSADKPKFEIGDEIKTDNEDPLTITKIDEQGYWSGDLFICNSEDSAKWELVGKHINKLEPKFKVKYAGNEYNVFDIKASMGIIWYGIEDEPNHIDYIKADSCEIISRISGYSKPTDNDMVEALRTEYEKGRADAIAQMQKPWSEEDENKIDTIISVYRPSPKLVNWLKSLKERYAWKPSDEQINTLRDAIIYVEGCNSNFKGNGSVLENLYLQLKKLKG